MRWMVIALLFALPASAKDRAEKVEKCAKEKLQICYKACYNAGHSKSICKEHCGNWDIISFAVEQCEKIVPYE